ncbi:hypothetical protein [Pontibacillus yanchengensis]|uniref:Uncharacterized protein n=1 Tax=Pontibacillus yanchengensis Y32 TaxID=1385514 RepID=A0A0A2TG34_9BACI|nr:hypothetical protein [Pontibacillus yanchengensis]KGP73378.1 hypothetical protein N782_05380 [Pontibacillus yanchengensis Y32]
MRIVLISITSILVLAILTFSISMASNPFKANKVEEKAKDYVDKKFDDNIEYMKILNDNMGNFPNLDYAAKMVNQADNIQFLVYENTQSGEMEDTYIAEKWEEALTEEITPYINEHFNKVLRFNVHFQQNVGKKFNVSSENPISFKEYDVRPSVSITLEREVKEGDKPLFNNFVTYLNEEIGLQKGFVTMKYSPNPPGPLLKKSWSTNIEENK